MEKHNVEKESETRLDPDKPSSSSKNSDTDLAAEIDTDTDTESDTNLSVSPGEMERLRQYFARNLGFQYIQENEQPQKVLSELTLDGIVQYIKERSNIKIITMVGAGVSTSAGIPDFRSPSSGIYHNLEKYNLKNPESAFELDSFMKNPEPFFTIARELLPKGFKPTPCHYFIRLLWQKGLLLRHYTQNIDMLERIAGIPNEKLVEAHGTFHTGKCVKCRTSYTFEWMKEKIFEELVPKCDKCKEGVVKPDVILFGEMLPQQFDHLSHTDFREADLLIIMGSSLVVQPFAALMDRVRPSCPRLLINKEKVGGQHRLARFLHLRMGLVFDPDSRYGGRDVAWLGDIDTGCYLFAEKLGWGDELKELVKKEHERLDKENASKD